MSGICGIIAMDGSSPSQDQITAMTGFLERRGPEATHHWRDGPAALGHTLLATTPEALEEELPFCDRVTGCVITADVRLDNREFLVSELNFSSRTPIVGDGELILRAYLHWGEACLDHLLGDFAFAIWDPRGQKLFCARDHMGMRQLNYTHQPERLVAFATDVPALLTVAVSPFRINEGRIADFLERLEGLDFTSTFFEGIFRLPPAHCLTCDADGLRIRRYWRLVPGPPLALDSDEAYARAFLEVFTEAVRCRLRSAGPVGSMLSGGMDSGAVVGVASRLLAVEKRAPLATFSAVGPDPEQCKETRAIHVASAMPGLQPHFINYADLGPYLNDLIRLTKACVEPFDAHMTLPRIVYLAAHHAGLKVVLDGVGGDSALTAGTQIARLLRTGRWRQAWQNLQGEWHFHGETYSIWSSLYWNSRIAFIPNWLKLAKEFVGRLLASVPSDIEAMVAPAFAETAKLGQRKQAYFSSFLRRRIPYAQERAFSIAGTHLAVGRERYDRVAAALPVEPRDPFLDIRVLDFCLRLPGDQLLEDGWPKVILRRAMAGLLPDEVRWRKGKENLGGTFTKALLDHWPSWHESVRQEILVLGRYLSPQCLEKIRLDKPIQLDSSLVQSFYLANWLKALRAPP